MNLSQEEIEVILYLWANYCIKVDKGIDKQRAISFGSEVYKDADLQKSLGYHDVHMVLSSLSKKNIVNLWMLQAGALTPKFFTLISQLEQKKLETRNQTIAKVLKRFIPSIEINLIKIG